jgi:anti-anti-sigma factor
MVSQWGLPIAQAVLDDFPFPLSIFRPDGLLVGTNEAGERFWGVPRDHSVGLFNPIQQPRSVEHGRMLKQVFAQAVQGQPYTTPPTQHDTPLSGMKEHHAQHTWITTTFFPLRDQWGKIGFVMAITQDVSVQVEQAHTLEAAQQELARQWDTIQVLSSPVIQVWDGILTVPIIGQLDARRATLITENLLEKIVATQAERVILDVTGVTVMDTQVASYVLTTASACRLLGSEVALVGISATVAQTMVHLGVDLSGIVTRANLQAGIAWAFAQQGLVVHQAKVHAHSGNNL